MCGIAGIVSRFPLTETDHYTVKEMNHIQEHRGPDDEGFYTSSNCCLGHRRLAILDLSELGHQPFSSRDGRYHIVYNGEIYNYLELREELETAHGWSFVSNSDTEVLLAMYMQFKQKCLNKLNGMFAFAVYDKLEKELFLARDRIGIKPLYYTVYHDRLIFASEIKAFKACPGLLAKLNYRALFDFLVFNRTDVEEGTFFRDIKRFPKGSYAFYNEELKITNWWAPSYYLSGNHSNGPKEIYQQIENKFINAVRLRMRSDVPVGSCLSGGLDSTIVAGILYTHELATSKYKTFTAAFPGDPIDETSYIDALNERYPFTNYRVYPTSEEALQRLKEFVYYNDEPTNSPSFFTQFMVMELASQNNIKVLLDGQGGDELFAGYQYFHGFYQYGLLKSHRFGPFLKEFCKTFMRGQHPSAYQTLLFQLMNRSLRKSALKKFVPYLTDDFFAQFINESPIFTQFFDVEGLNSSLVRHFEYKLEHLLRIEDRNSMRFSIEARVPYLDYEVVEYVIGVPESLKIQNGETKALQKQALGAYTIERIRNRKDKIGFGTPGEKWMATKAWEEKCASSYRFLRETYPDIFKKVEHLPRTNHTSWKMCQLATWHELFVE